MPWLLSHITIVETTESREGGINPVEMNIIHHLKELAELEIEPPVLKSDALPTKLWGSAYSDDLFNIVRYGVVLNKARSSRAWFKIIGRVGEYL